MEPKLAPPGAGLPFFQQLFLRFALVPYISRKTSWEEDLARFEKEGKIILSLINNCPDSDLTQRALVPPLPGLEDSSRNWSVAMTLEHLMIVGQQMDQAITKLSQGKLPQGVASTAAVKPEEQSDGKEAVNRFQAFVSQHGQMLLKKVENRNSKLCFRHPWFGPLTAKQWFWLMGVHQQIHRRQVKAILDIDQAKNP